MLSSPYPVPDLKVYRAAMSLGWIAGVGAGAWVLAAPPVSYEGLGAFLTGLWGVFLAVGSAIVSISHAARKYKSEVPGLVLVLGGVFIYAYLSWEQALTTSPGSGPRACLLLVLAALIIARIRILMHIDRQARRMASLRDRGTDE